MTPLDLDKSIPYSIVGSPKCGTSSLGEYMRKNCYDVTEDELHFSDSDFASKLSLRSPIIILRDPVERAWSDYNFFFTDGHNTLEKACEWSKYEKYIPLFRDPIIFYLEDLIKIPDFPKHNDNPNKPKLDDITRKKIEDILGNKQNWGNKYISAMELSKVSTK